MTEILTGVHKKEHAAPSLSRALVWSVVLHLAWFAFLTFGLSTTLRVAPPVALQVRLVGVPQPKEAVQKVVKPEEIRTQDSASPYDPPPDAKQKDSEAASKFATETAKPPEKTNEELMDSKKRPPTLDKRKEEKKVVKNKPDAKVVKNPEDFLAALNFVDKLDTKPVPKAGPKASDKPAGEGPQIQLNLSERGEVDAIRQHIEDNWLKPPGMRTDKLETVVVLEVRQDGSVVSMQVTQGSGNTGYDNSILRAIQKSVPLPIPTINFSKFQVLELHFQG